MAGLDGNNIAEVTFDLAEADGNGLRVRITGELDITNVDALESAVGSALARHPGRLILDLSGLRFADSSAIALWVRWSTAVHEIELRDVSPILRRVIDSMGLADTLNVKP
ncbi:MAG TPA: STAS domain-containing protein [Solirubrobacteraceae bacterium]|nr:STAS domain-containing protein [Solirubrobacteraceae bacterium]